MAIVRTPRKQKGNTQMTDIILYGIKNCNTVKKARAYLTENAIDYIFHDFKSQGIGAEKLTQWCALFSWEKTINRAGMTWRKLSDEQKQSIHNNATATPLMQEKTSLIKRPVLEINGQPALLGFKEDRYAELLGKTTP